MSIDVHFVLSPHVLMLDFTGPAEAMRLAARFGAPLRLHFNAPMASVPSSLGLPLAGLAPLPDSLDAGALVIVPGCEDSVLHYAEAPALALVDWLRRLPDSVRVASVCSGAMLLAMAGLLDGRRCTTHHSVTGRLIRQAPSARVEEDRIFVEDGRVLTSAGITSGIDLALHLIEGIAGPQCTQAVAREMVVFMRRNGHDAQLSPWLAHRNHLHPAVHRVQDALSRDPAREWPRAELAAQACVSERHLARLFQAHAGTSLGDYQRRLRIALARQLLENPRVSVERAAELSGFGSARDLRRVWARFESGTPGKASAD